MAHKKKKKGKIIQMQSPENYIRQRARTLPVFECWINSDWREADLANIAIARKHSNNNITLGVFLVDLGCLGVKDSSYYFNISQNEYNEILDYSQQYFETEKAEYSLVHNIIYAGLEFAEDYGFRPHNDFKISEYILEEDNDKIPMMEIECGKDGKPHYVSGTFENDETINKIISQLEKTAGPGNFFYSYYDEETDDFEDEEPINFEEALEYNKNEVEGTSTFQFKIQLKNVNKPNVWRRITVPAYFSFSHFHLIIQAAFGWGEQHLYSFSPTLHRSFPIIEEMDNEDQLFEPQPGSRLDASETKLLEIFKEEGQKFVYVYDFGDNWEHQITLEKTLPASTLLPDCIEGKGACPPEDCGGPWGYENLKMVMADKSNPEYDELAEWLFLEEDETWDPNEFDLEATKNDVQHFFIDE